MPRLQVEADPAGHDANPTPVALRESLFLGGCCIGLSEHLRQHTPLAFFSLCCLPGDVNRDESLLVELFNSIFFHAFSDFSDRLPVTRVHGYFHEPELYTEVYQKQDNVGRVNTSV